MDDNEKVVALELARELDGELGGGVVAAMQDECSNRSFGLSEAATLAGLILSAVQIAMQYLSDKKITELDARLEAHLPQPNKVSSAKRTRIIRKVSEKFGR